MMNNILRSEYSATPGGTEPGRRKYLQSLPLKVKFSTAHKKPDFLKSIINNMKGHRVARLLAMARVLLKFLRI
jgi:hypothetical protein